MKWLLKISHQKLVLLKKWNKRDEMRLWWNGTICDCEMAFKKIKLN